MKKKDRVTKNEDFAKIVKTGKTRKNESFTIHTLRNTLNRTRVGISVSSRLGSAVVRNRIKRQVRSMCDAFVDYNSYSLDLVIVVKQQFMANDFSTNSDLLKSLILLIKETAK